MACLPFCNINIIFDIIIIFINLRIKKNYKIKNIYIDYYLPTIVILLSFKTIMAKKGYEPDLRASATLYPSPDCTLHAQNKVCVFIYRTTSRLPNVFLYIKIKF